MVPRQIHKSLILNNSRAKKIMKNNPSNSSSKTFRRLQVRLSPIIQHSVMKKSGARQSKSGVMCPRVSFGSTRRSMRKKQWRGGRISKVHRLRSSNKSIPNIHLASKTMIASSNSKKYVQGQARTWRWNNNSKSSPHSVSLSLLQRKQITVRPGL